MPDNPADLLNDLVGGLDYPYLVESSVKFRCSRLFPDRLLLSVRKAALGTEPADTLRKMLLETGFPESDYRKLLAHLDDADIIHFGYEGHDKGYLYKCYLEYAGKYAGSWERETQDRLLVYIAFKWDPAEKSRARTSYYHSHPATTAKEVEKFLLDVYGDYRSSTACTVTRELLATDAVTKIDGDLMVLSVTEEGNNRLSFDLNMYDAELKLSFMENQLAQVADYFKIEKTVWRDYFNAHRNKSLGHLAGGVEGNGNEFYTVYFGVEKKTPS